uniref:Uncharacterized protein n=1 Tax=Magallana gigas TaxID=29159 RepID=A0A8W8JGC0_MAGGI
MLNWQSTLTKDLGTWPAWLSLVPGATKVGAQQVNSPDMEYLGPARKLSFPRQISEPSLGATGEKHQPVQATSEELIKLTHN